VGLEVKVGKKSYSLIARYFEEKKKIEHEDVKKIAKRIGLNNAYVKVIKSNGEVEYLTVNKYPYSLDDVLEVEINSYNEAGVEYLMDFYKQIYKNRMKGIKVEYIGFLMDGIFKNRNERNVNDDNESDLDEILNTITPDNRNYEENEEYVDISELGLDGIARSISAGYDYDKFIDVVEKMLRKENYEEIEMRVPESFMVIGCGGIGSWVSYILASIGANNLYLVDGDNVEISNVGRTIYDLNDVNDCKVVAISRKIELIRPDINLKKLAVSFNFRTFEETAHNLLCDKFYKSKGSPLIMIDCRDSNEITNNNEEMKYFKEKFKEYNVVYYRVRYDGHNITIQRGFEDYTMMTVDDGVIRGYTQGSSIFGAMFSALLITYLVILDYTFIRTIIDDVFYNTMADKIDDTIRFSYVYEILPKFVVNFNISTIFEKICGSWIYNLNKEVLENDEEEEE